MTIAWSPICLNAAYEPRANPGFTGTPFTVTLRSVRGMPMRKTSPDCICPALPTACSTAFQSGSAPRAAVGTATAIRRPNPTTAYWICRSLRSLITAAPSSRMRLMETHDVRPVDVSHERVDVFRGVRAVVEMWWACSYIHQPPPVTPRIVRSSKAVTDATKLEACISVLEIARAVEPGLYAVANRHDPHRVPLTERRRLDARGRQLTPASVVVVALLAARCPGHFLNSPLPVHRR